MLKDILVGFSNLARAKLGIGNENVESEAIRRYVICLQCPEIKTTGCTIPGDCCGLCGCNLPAKVRSDSLCKIDKWTIKQID